MTDLKAGWAVVGNDGRRLGTLQEAGQDYLAVSRGAFSGLLFVPASAIANVERDVVHLNLAKNEAEQMGWEQPPREPDTATPDARPAPPAVPTEDAAIVPEAGGISGVHAIVFTPAVAEVRAFFADVLRLPSVEAGVGWPIFALPPAELAVHPAEAPGQAIYLMCDDIEATLAILEGKGVAVRRPVRAEAWGLVTEIVLAGGTELAIYEPRHPSPVARHRADTP